MFIYLDNNATTRLDPQALEAMLPFLQGQYANPSSLHQFGQQSRHAVETAREQVACALNTRARRIVFTGGGTEANDLAIRGSLAARSEKRHFITTRVEHDSILRLAGALEAEGYRVTYLEVDSQGQLDLEQYAAHLSEETALVSVMLANNETGVIFPIRRMAEMAAERGIPFHTDATQTVGKQPLDVNDLPVSLLTMAAHKFHGPKGVGAIYIKRGTKLRARLLGGHQEGDYRAGTENVAGIVGMGAALRLAIEHLEEENTRVRAMRDRLERGILERVDRAHVLGGADNRLPNTTLIGFEALEAEAVLMLLSNHGLCASSGSACSSGSLEPSHVLAAMDIAERIAHGAVRFSLSRFNTDQEIDRSLETIPQVIDRLATLQPRSTQAMG